MMLILLKHPESFIHIENGSMYIIGKRKIFRSRTIWKWDSKGMAVRKNGKWEYAYEINDGLI